MVMVHNTKRKTTEQFKKEVYEMYQDEYTVLGEYKNSKTKVLIKHNKCGNTWEATPNNFLRGAKCPYCSKSYHKKWTNEDFLQKVANQVGDEYTFLEPYQGSDTKIRVKHNKCGNVYEITPYRFLKQKQRCPKCAISIRAEKNRKTPKKKKKRVSPLKKTNEQFKHEVKEAVGDEYTFLDPYVNRQVKIKVRHNKCGHVYEVTPTNFLRGRRCPKCFGKHKRTPEQFKQDIYNLVGNEYTVLSDYKNRHSKVKIKHNKCGHVWEVEAGSFLSGTRCPICSINHATIVRRKDANEFRKQAQKILGIHYKLLSEYKDANTSIKVYHDVCGRTYLTNPSSILTGHGCPYCGGSFQKNTEIFKKEVQQILGKDYTVLGEYVNNRTKIKIRHDICGHTYEVRPTDITDHHNGCPYCNQSHGERDISNILAEHGINYDYPKKFTDLKDKEMLHYDFFVPDQNTLIEYQGIQHYQSLGIFGGDKQYELQQNHDQMKRKYAKDNGYNLIEVPYTEDTPEKIKNYLVSHGLKLTNDNYQESMISFKEVSSSEILSLMLHYHYLHRRVSSRYCFALYYGTDLAGMIVYSGNVRKSVYTGISDLATKDNTLELSRLYIKDYVSQNIPNITSKFVGWSLRQLKLQGNYFILSFADQGMNHFGAIYQATNFLYCGKTQEGIFCYQGPDKKGGRWVKGHHYRFFIIRSPKYRYIMAVGNKRFKKHAKHSLKFKVQSYPKGDEQHYSVGDKEERLIRDRNTGIIYTETQLLKKFPDYDWDNQ